MRTGGWVRRMEGGDRWPGKEQMEWRQKTNSQPYYNSCLAARPSNPLTHQLSSIFDRITKRSQHIPTPSPRIPSGNFTALGGHGNWHHLLLKMCRGCCARHYVCAYPIRIGVGPWIRTGGHGDYPAVRTASVYGEEPAGGIISTLNSEGADGACLKCWRLSGGGSQVVFMRVYYYWIPLGALERTPHPTPIRILANVRSCSWLDSRTVSQLKVKSIRKGAGKLEGLRLVSRRSRLLRLRLVV